MPAYSSSVERRNFSAFATDVFPNDKSVQNDQSCFISTPELHPWLLVDLLQPANVDYFAVRKLGYPGELKE